MSFKLTHLVRRINLYPPNATRTSGISLWKRKVLVFYYERRKMEEDDLQITRHKVVRTPVAVSENSKPTRE
jgi:hypothetical protein